MNFTKIGISTNIKVPFLKSSKTNLEKNLNAFSLPIDKKQTVFLAFFFQISPISVLRLEFYVLVK